MDSFVYGINNAGTAVGSATTSTGALHAYMSNNGTYEAYNVNDAGQIVGTRSGN